MNGQIILGLGEILFDREHGKTLDEYKQENVSKAGKQQFKQLQKLGLGISLRLT